MDVMVMPCMVVRTMVGATTSRPAGTLLPAWSLSCSADCHPPGHKRHALYSHLSRLLQAI